MTRGVLAPSTDVSNRNELIRAIGGHLFALGLTDNPYELCGELLAREEIVSTFAGFNTAIPHTISKYVSEPILTVFYVLSDSFVWSNEFENVKFVFCLVVPESEDLSQQRAKQSEMFGRIGTIISDRETLELLKCVKNKHRIKEYLGSQLNIAF